MSNALKKSDLRVLVLGGSGMLGRHVVAALQANGVKAFAPARSSADVTGPLAGYLQSGRIDCIVNCAGVIPQRGRASAEMVLTNAYAPHLLASYGIPIIHISTDCVFDGIPDLRWPGRRYETDHRANATDLYGRSKALGEVQAPHVTNVRTSFIGPDHGLWAWLIGEAQAGRAVQGWQEAWWTGSTVEAVALKIAGIAASPPGGMTVHLATTDKISKWEVLLHLKAHLGLGVQIVPTREPRIDRALLPTHLLPPLAEALAALRSSAVAVGTGGERP